MNSVLSSFIAIAYDLEAFKEELEENYKDKRIVFFFKDDFLVEDAKAVIAESYIAESQQKIIALGAKTFNLIAQNTLLKVLEEPPRNIVFIVCIPTKTALLSTIRSRLPIKKFYTQEVDISSGLNFSRLTIKDIYEFLNKHKRLDKREVAALIQSNTKEAIQSGIHFKDKDLTLFSNLLQLASLNGRASVLLSTQLLTILKRVNS